MTHNVHRGAYWDCVRPGAVDFQGRRFPKWAAIKADHMDEVLRWGVENDKKLIIYRAARLSSSSGSYTLARSLDQVRCQNDADDFELRLLFDEAIDEKTPQPR